MQQSRAAIMTLALAAAVSLTLGTSGVWAEGYGKEGHAGGGHNAMGGHGMGGMMHSSTGHLIRHLLKHEKEIGLTADQVAKLKDVQLNLDKTRIKAEADIQVAERELKALTDDEKSDLSCHRSQAETERRYAGRSALDLHQDQARSPRPVDS